jgi:hypothetical protein
MIQVRGVILEKKSYYDLYWPNFNQNDKNLSKRICENYV